MNILLSSFNGKQKIYKISCDKNRATEYASQNYNVLLLQSNNAYLLPENNSFVLTEEEFNYLKSLGDDACIEINDNGRIASVFGKEYDNTLYITDKCNSNCIMCPMAEPIRKNGHTVPFEILKELVRYMPSNMEHLTITGGEPFYIKEQLFDLLKDLKNHNKVWSYLLLSNGRIFANKDYCLKFAAVVPEDFLVGIPIHGPNAEIHDAISQCPGSFKQTTSGIHNLLATHKMSVEIRIVVNRINAPHLKDIAILIADQFPGVDSVKIMGMEMLGNAIVNSESVWISYDEAFTYMKPTIDYLVEKAIDVAIYNFPLCFINKSYWHLCANSITSYKIKYLDECVSCIEKSACGGIFTGTDKYLKGKVKPIIR